MIIPKDTSKIAIVFKGKEINITDGNK